ncbi:transposase family protein [Streptomyces sp. NPDC005266]|uniref:transposase family protein n=1 Tax=Streptomyces sp. NPDC005266 TaxID=3154877 RepID=UPI0033B78479
MDADTRLVAAVGRPVAGNRNDCKVWELSGAKAAVGRTTVIADGGYRGRRLSGHRPGHPAPPRTRQTALPAWKEEHNTSHRKVRARLEHVGARMKTWKVLRDCRLKGDGIHTAMLGVARIHTAMLGIARLHNLALTG